MGQVFSADVVTGRRAKEIGLIDDIAMLEDVVEREFKGSKVVDFSKVSKIEQLQSNFKMGMSMII